MPLITARRKCFICSKIMETGELFVWGTLRSHGVDRKLPMHPEHDTAFTLNKSRLDALIEEAAANGHDNPEHHIQGEKKLADESIAAELTNEIARAEKWGYGYVTLPRLKSIVTKHSVDVPGDISTQPGEWQVRGGYVEAKQHEGGERGARDIRDWIAQRGGNSAFLGTYDQEVDHTRVRLDSPREPNIIGKDWWVIKTADGIFYTLPDADFHVLYVPRES